MTGKTTVFKKRRRAAVVKELRTRPADGDGHVGNIENKARDCEHGFSMGRGRKILRGSSKRKGSVMKKLVLFAAVLAGVGAAPVVRGQATAQQQPATIASVLNSQYGLVEQQFVSAAEAMPEDKYSFAPTNGDFKGVRTFAEEVKHVAFANHLFFAPLTGETIDMKSVQQNPNGPANLKTKAEIVQYLKDSFALGHRAISEITAENAATPLPKPALPFLSTRLAIASIGCWHPMDHYGQMVEYLRMNNITPPASQRPQQQPPQQNKPGK
jgi:DinB superfamily